MQYIKLSEDKYIEYDGETETAKVVVKSVLAKQIQEAQARLSAIPALLDDKILLEWARVNHPQAMDYSAEKASLEQIITTNKAILESMK